MSAFLYIDIEDVPQRLRETSAQRIDSVTGATLIKFAGYQFAGQSEPEKPRQIEFAYPRRPDLRAELLEWLWRHGINFAVVF